MKELISLFLCFMVTLFCDAQNESAIGIRTELQRSLELSLEAIDRREIIPVGSNQMVSRNMAFARSHSNGDHSANHDNGNSGQTGKEETEEEDDFIFDPVGEERMFVMSLYSYDQKNSKFVQAQSLKSQVRYAADGKTVYFKDLTKSLGVITWLKGTIDGDTIRVPYGQPLAYYKDKYLIFFSPMLYDDATGNMEVQDEFKLVIKGDSLCSPALKEGTFQAAVGYVFITDKNQQGSLSIDLDHGMRRLEKRSVAVPEDVEAKDYVFTYKNSYDMTQKTKVKVKKNGNDLYMQLSTSAPKAWVYGQLKGDSVYVESGQVITDSTFIYFYSLADPVYKDGELVDFTPATSGCRLVWRNDSLFSSSEVFSVDYLDGMDLCMDYVTHPELAPYKEDVLSKPLKPEWVKIDVESGLIGSISMNYICFNQAALNVDSAYINEDLLYYRVYFNDSLFTFTPSQYASVPEAMTDMPYAWVDGYDFFTNGKQHYVYIYKTKEELRKIGVQSVYKVRGEEMCSDMLEYLLEIPEDTVASLNYDLALLSCRLVDNMALANDTITIRGTVKNLGKSTLSGYRLSYTVSGQSAKALTNSKSLAAGDEDEFEIKVGVGAEICNRCPVYLKLMPLLLTITDEDMTNNYDTVYFSVYEKTFANGKVLLEEFTSESCGWCPYGASRIHTAIDEAGLENDVIWICHHEGYGKDWLTVEESTEYTALYGGNTFAPAMMLNRNQKYSDESYPVFGIGEVKEVEQILKSAIGQPCFVKVGVKAEWNSGKAVVSVEAEKCESFDGQCPEAMLTLLVVEDSIKSRKQKTYDSHTIPYHINALRKVLTPVWGQKVAWEGNTAVAEFEYEIPEDYVAKNLRFVAFIHEYDEDVNSRRVYNSEVCSLSGVSTGIKAESGKLKGESGKLKGESRAYNLMGQRVSQDAKGIIIVDGRKFFNK